MADTPHKGYRFGKLLELIPEEVYMRELDLSRKAFRAWCRSLHVPLIFKDRRALVDHGSFLIAMKAIGRIGRPDFALPGSTPKQHFKGRRAPFVTELDPQYVHDNLTTVLAELLYSQDLLGFETVDEAVYFAKKAAERLVLQGLATMPAAEQAEFEKKALRRLQKKHGPSLQSRLESVLPDPPLIPQEEEDDLLQEETPDLRGSPANDAGANAEHA